MGTKGERLFKFHIKTLIYNLTKFAIVLLVLKNSVLLNLVFFFKLVLMQC